jgi:hypothetical protein
MQKRREQEIEITSKKRALKRAPKLHYAFRDLRVFLVFLTFLMRFLPAITGSPQAYQLRN